jgi:hypothetical protein
MTRPDPNQVARTAAVDFARHLVPYWQATLGIELIGAYLMGSLAHGGFSRRYSDVDVALVTEAGLSAQALDHVRNEAGTLSAEWGPKLSVFWTDRRFCVGRFPPLDRIDYLDHAVVLTERERVRPMRPAQEEIQRYLGGAPFANWTDQVRRFATAEILEPKDRKAYLRTLLVSGAILLQLDDRPHGLERGCCGVSSQNTSSASRRKLARQRAVLSPDRRRSRLSLSSANVAAVSARRLCGTSRWTAFLRLSTALATEGNETPATGAGIAHRASRSPASDAVRETGNAPLDSAKGLRLSRSDPAIVVRLPATRDRATKKSRT